MKTDLSGNSRLQVNEYDADTLAVLEDGSFIVDYLRPGAPPVVRGSEEPRTTSHESRTTDQSGSQRAVQVTVTGCPAESTIANSKVYSALVISS